jgi:hypothetical protein
MKRSKKNYTGVDIDDLMAGKVSEKVAQRLLAAENVCWGFTNAVALGLMNDIPLENRGQLIDNMTYNEWADLAAETGILPNEE